jgi:hypothetical protein
MKKLFYSIITILTTATVAQAQLVLDRSDFASAGERFTMAYDTLVTVDTNFYKGGTGKTWSFSTMTKDSRFVTKYHNASSTPDGSMFPSADLAYQEDSTDPYMYYMETSSSEVRIIGGNDSSETSQVNFRAFIFPLQYNTTWYDSNKFSQVFPGADLGMPFDSVKLDITIQFRNKVDAEGSIQIPDYSGNVLRVRRVIWNKVDVKGKYGSFPYISLGSQEDSTFTFDFVADNGKNWIARFDQIQDDDYEVLFKDLYPMSVKKIKLAQFSVYPNPAKDMFNVNLKSSSATFTVMSLNGAEVIKGELSQGLNEISCAGLARGVYMLNIVDNTGAIRAEKLVIE